MHYIIIFCTQWGYQDGGINCFNYDFTISLGSALKNKPYKLVSISYAAPEIAVPDDKLTEFNMSLLCLNRPDQKIDEHEDKQIIKGYLKDLKNVSSFIFIGHDVFTGGIANAMRQEFKTSTKSIIFHHIDSQFYYAIKRPESIQDNKKKIAKQTEILQNADIVVSIGPKLLKSAKSKTSSLITMIIPGFHRIQICNIRKTFSAITFGRYDRQTDNLKQMKLAVAAFSDYIIQHIETMDQSTLKIVGVQDEEEMKDLLETNTNRNIEHINIVIKNYTDNREELFKDLNESSVCLMLSVHEGFGLAGYEAIAAGVPLILSQNSGLYDFLTSLLSASDLKAFGIYPLVVLGTYDGSINGSDLRNVRDAIHEIWTNMVDYKTGILKLRAIISDKFSWGHCAGSFVKILENIPETRSL